MAAGNDQGENATTWVGFCFHTAFMNLRAFFTCMVSAIMKIRILALAGFAILIPHGINTFFFIFGSIYRGQNSSELSMRAE